MACDTKSQLPYIIKAVEKFKSLGISPSRIFVYTLIRDFEDSLFRINEMKKLGVNPFAQPYLDFDKPDIKNWQKDLARWTNRKELFKSMDFKDYSPRKGFKCKQYFDK